MVGWWFLLVGCYSRHIPRVIIPYVRGFVVGKQTSNINSNHSLVDHTTYMIARPSVLMGIPTSRGNEQIETGNASNLGLWRGLVQWSCENPDMPKVKYSIAIVNPQMHLFADICLYHNIETWAAKNGQIRTTTFPTLTFPFMSKHLIIWTDRFCLWYLGMQNCFPVRVTRLGLRESVF